MKNKQEQFYVVAQYVIRPRNKNQTFNAAYMSDERNYQYDELFNIVTNIRDKDLQKYGIILDLNNKRIIKNTFNSDKSYAEIIEYFSANYSERFTQMLGDYIKEVTATIEKVA